MHLSKQLPQELLYKKQNPQHGLLNQLPLKIIPVKHNTSKKLLFIYS